MTPCWTILDNLVPISLRYSIVTDHQPCCTGLYLDLLWYNTFFHTPHTIKSIWEGSFYVVDFGSSCFFFLLPTGAPHPQEVHLFSLAGMALPCCHLGFLLLSSKGWHLLDMLPAASDILGRLNLREEWLAYRPTTYCCFAVPSFLHMKSWKTKYNKIDVFLRPGTNLSADMVLECCKWGGVGLLWILNSHICWWTLLSYWYWQIV